MPGLLDETQRRLATLDLMPGASWTQVKDRYRFLAKVWHPDRFGADPRARARAEKQFKTVNEAYQWLLRHQDFVESLADSDEPEGSAAGSARGADGHTQASTDSEPEEPSARARSFKTPGKPIDESAVERFLWGVIATFTLIAFVVFVASGALSRLLNTTDSEDPGEDSTAREPSASTAAGTPASRDDYRWVTASRLYVRSGPDRSATAVTVLERGSRVRVRAQSGLAEWLAVVDESGTTVGWVHGDYLSTNAPAARRSAPPVAEVPARSMEDMEADFVTMARANGEAAAMATEVESPAGGEMELIRGAWKPKNPDPAAQRRDANPPSGDDPDLEHWTGAVEGVVPADLPRVTLRMFEDVEAGQPLGTAVYWRPSGACTYSLEVIQEEGDWIRTAQAAESPQQCAAQGEIWFMIRGSNMTAIWHRLDGRRWFTSRLRLN